jgi:hypothetical protein
MAELLIGCGHTRMKRLGINGREGWTDLVTLDSNPDCKPDVIHDLDAIPYPFGSDTFDEIHAYHVLEHCGRQGDWKFFFAQWSELWKIIKPGGVFCGIVPHHSSPWAWGDPSHTRIISVESFTFLDQDSYADCGKTSMTDFRPCYKANWKLLHQQVTDDLQQIFILQAVKP